MKSQNANTLVIFGASDNEEQLAREIAEAAGCQTATATFKGKPVHAGNAYLADGYRIDRPQINPNHQTFEPVERVVIFECARQLTSGFNSSDNVRCDHHNPGDPGYSKGPEEFWMGSSLGQLCSVIIKGENTPMMAAIELSNSAGNTKTIDQLIKELVCTAAGDHCPKDAYAGNCPGIDPEEFGMFRRTQIWRFECKKQKLDESLRGKLEKHGLVGEIYDDIMAAVRTLEAGTKVNGIVDLREKGLIPQLPEAALMSGAAYMAKIDEVDRERNPTGNKKIVLGGHTSPDQVKAFMAWASNLVNRIGEPYGNPTRGFAGVVVTERSCPTCKGAWACETLGTCPECGVPYPPESQIG